MFDRILLALDDSPAGEVALLFAGALARRTGASVHVLHVNERVVAGAGTTLRTRDEVSDLVTSAVRQLADIGVPASGSACVAWHRGVPARIVAKAEGEAADAIVLGSTRRRLWGRLFAAQVRERTTRLSSLTVLTAPSPLRVTSLPEAESGDGRLDQALDSLLR
ncbi:MAG TPA: universal stress protein [Acidimicrobiales bacterium]|jgi:nucleotide-binding universal stress UspA family protein